MSNRSWISGALVAVAGLTLIWAGVGQSQSNLSLDSLNRELQTLRTTVQNQERRIVALEQKLAQTPSTSQPSQTASTAPVSPQQTGQVPGWHLPANWARLQRGMSEQQVVAILGSPTRAVDGSYRKIYYEGEVAGSGFVTSYVEFDRDKRLLGVAPPVFLNR